MKAIRFRLKMWISRQLASITDTRALIDELAWRASICPTSRIPLESTLEQIRKRTEWYMEN